MSDSSREVLIAGGSRAAEKHRRRSTAGGTAEPIRSLARSTPLPAADCMGKIHAQTKLSPRNLCLLILTVLLRDIEASNAARGGEGPCLRFKNLEADTGPQGHPPRTWRIQACVCTSVSEDLVHVRAMLFERLIARLETPMLQLLKQL